MTSIRTQAANTDRTISREILFAHLSSVFALLVLAAVVAAGYAPASRASKVDPMAALRSE